MHAAILAARALARRQPGATALARPASGWPPSPPSGAAGPTGPSSRHVADGIDEVNAVRWQKERWRGWVGASVGQGLTACASAPPA